MAYSRLSFLLFFTIISSIISCRDSKINECTLDLFQDYYKSPENDLKNIFELKSIKFLSEINQCSYEHSFKFWKGISDSAGKYIPAFQMNGNVYLLNDVVYLIPSKNSNPIKYFDFNLTENDSILINYHIESNNIEVRQPIIKTYYLKLEDKFKEFNYSDTIYKFRFNKFGVSIPQDDLVFFVSKKGGIHGVYNGIFLTEGKEEVFSSRGNIFKERYSNRNIMYDLNME